MVLELSSASLWRSAAKATLSRFVFPMEPLHPLSSAKGESALIALLSLLWIECTHYKFIFRFSLTVQTAESINFDSMLKMAEQFVLADQHPSIKVTFPMIHRERAPNTAITTRQSQKKLQVTFDKRRVISNFGTLPHGY
jgi:hypothetical protein